jgi:hypothetical protein
VDPELSPLESLTKGHFEAALITTYNAFLPFYEEIMLRKLVALGCRYNVVLMDSTEWVKCLADPLQRPRFAGCDYTLLPMQASGVFHPKILLLVGKKRGLVVVGSHNLTLSGFCHNRELTNMIEISGPDDGAGIVIAQAVCDFLRAWLERQQGHIPSALLQAVKKIWSFAPWLEKAATSPEGVRFLGSYPQGPSLWDQLISQLSHPIKRVIVLGAFFDPELAFIKAIQRDLQPAELVIGIDPETVTIPTHGQSDDGSVCG